MAQLTDTLILNTKYSIFNDIDRMLIGTNPKYTDESIYTPAHPIHAIMLSLFDGKKILNDNIKEIVKLFNINEIEALSIIEPFIENNEKIIIEYNKQIYTFPEKILVHAKQGETRNDLSIDNCLIDKEINTNRIRLSIPKSILFVINTKCVTDCIYCYANKKHSYKPMSTNQIISIIDQAHSIGIQNISVSGGEFFLQKDWPLIAKHLIDMGYDPDFSTKVPISNSDIDLFQQIGIKKLQVSLDTLDTHLLQKTLKVNQNYKNEILKTIKYLDQKGIELTIKGTQTRETCDVSNIKEMIDFISTLKNVVKYTVTIVGYSHYKTIAEFQQFKTTPEQIKNLGIYLNEIQKTKNFKIHYDNAVHKEVDLCNYSVFKERAMCSANVESFVLLPDGQVTLCEELYWNPDFIIGDLTKNSIMEVWQSERAFALWNLQKDNLTDDNPCKYCNDFDNCRKGLGVCWKSVIAHYGDDKAFYPDPTCPKAPKPNFQVYYKKNEMS